MDGIFLAHHTRTEKEDLRPHLQQQRLFTNCHKLTTSNHFEDQVVTKAFEENAEASRHI